MASKQMYHRIAVFVIVVCLCFFSCASTRVSKELGTEYYVIAQAFNEQKNYKKAAEYYEKARTYNAVAMSASYELARLYVLSEEYEKADVELQALLQTDPENGTLLSAYAYVLLCLKRYDESLLAYQKMRLRNTFDLKSGKNYLSLLFATAHYTEMPEVLDSLASLYPDDEGLKKLRVLYALKTNQPDCRISAATWLESKSNASDGAVLTVFAEYYTGQELYLDALNIYAKVTGIYQTADLLLEMAYLCYEKIDDAEQAGTHLTAALKKTEADSTAVASFLARLSEKSKIAANDCIATATKTDESATEKDNSSANTGKPATEKDNSFANTGKPATEKDNSSANTGKPATDESTKQ